MLRQRTNHLYFLILPIFIIFNMLKAWNVQDFLSPDSYYYIKISELLPCIEDSIFPFLYPLFLKLTNFIFNDYLISYKALNIISILFCCFYTYRHNFFWKEIWVILSFASFQSNYIFGWSENIVLPILIVYFNINYTYLNNDISRNNFLFKNTAVIILLILTKYNSIFFIFSTFSFFILFIRTNKYFPLLISNLVASFFLLFYLTFNYFHIGYITGNRSGLEKLSFFKYLNQSKYNILPTIDPFGYSLIKIRALYSLIKHFHHLPHLFSILFLCFIGIYIYRLKPKIVSNFTLFCLTNSFIFFILTLITAKLTSIDLLNPRLLLGFSLPLLLSLANYSHENNFNIKPKYLFMIGFLSSALYNIICLV